MTGIQTCALPISSVEGVYHYFYSVDDNNWVEIANVPAEMRSFIDSIIFARNT